MNDQKPKRKRAGVGTLVLVLLLISVIGNAILFTQLLTVYQAEEPPEDSTAIYASITLAQDLEMARMELNKYRGISSRLDSLVDEANEKISEQEASIAKLRAEARHSKEAMQQLEEERNRLLALKADYLEQIDNLLTQNDALRSQNMLVNQTLKHFQSEVVDLKQKVDLGERLLADNIEIRPVKKNLLGKYRETSMAKKTAGVEVCFDVIENKLAPPGRHKLSLSMYSFSAIPVPLPHEGEVAAAGYSVNPGTAAPALFAMDTVFNYGNAKQHICMEWRVPMTYVPGSYLVELRSDRNTMGVASFTLR